ncbi:hypothetical protein Ancab_000403 [Ancistrocladus abbreviatus]
MGMEQHNERSEYLEMEDVNFSDSELVSHVKEALRLVSSGDSDSYNQLVGVLYNKVLYAPDEVALLVTSLKAISGAVSYVDIKLHESLLTAIFGMSMWNYGTDVMDALVELIISLAASSGKLVDSCLEMLVNNFTPPYSFLEVLNQPRGVAKKEQVLGRVHSALEDIADLVPLAPSSLLPIIVHRMPNVFTKEPLMALYVENMLKLEGSAIGELVGSGMLIRAVVDRLIDLDVEIGWDDILSEDPTKGIFEMELEEEETLVASERDGIEFPSESLTRKSLGGNVVADKLDSLMVLTFEHLKSCEYSGRLVEVFESLLQSFQITVLNAYKSKFAQFIMFYACSLDPESCGVRFAKFLADVFVSSNFPLLTRMSAVAYLASYLARGRFLSTSFITSMLERLVQWCSEYCWIQHGGVNPKAHRVFYAACQAVMYILCFRMRSIMDIPRLKSQLSLMPVGHIFKNSLDPLKVCLPSIVEEFRRQAKAANLLDEFGVFVFSDMLESELSRAFGGVERLDMFFPFDPILLRKCDSFIRPNFVYWSMVRTTYDDEDDDESDDGDDDVVELVHAHGGESIAESFEEHNYPDDFHDSLNRMSITPKDSLHWNFGAENKHIPTQMPSRIRPSTSPESL